MVRALFTSVVCLGALSIAPCPAYAQRPNSGLFGSGGGPPGRQSLELTGAASWAWDSNTPFDNPSALANQGTEPSAFYPTANLGVTYTRRLGRRGSLFATGSTDGVYSSGFVNKVVTNESAGVGVQFGLGRRSAVTLSEGVGYSPFYVGVFAPTPTITDPQNQASVPSSLYNGFDYSVGLRRMWRASTRVGWNTTLSSRSTFEVSYDRNDSTLLRLADDPTSEESVLRDQHVGFRFRRQLSRWGSLHLGYGYRYGAYRTGDVTVPARGSDIDAGVDVSKTLSVSGRRTTLAFSTGSSFFVTGGSTTVPTNGGFTTTSTARETHFALLGSATLVHEIGRSWSARLGYNRGVSFVPGLADPLVSDSITAGVSGNLSRRVSGNVLAAYTAGSTKFAVFSNDFGSGTASAMLQFALTRHLAAYTEYAYYRLNLGSTQLVIPAEFGTNLNRHGVRAGVKFWVPLLR